jgi:carboxymethylenebutenolidase
MQLVQKYAPNAPKDLESLFDTLKSHPDCNGKIGSVGFCFGGRLSLTLGISRPVDAICTFYGGGMQMIFDQLRNNLKAPVLGLFGDADVSIPAGTVGEFIMYPKSGHAFFRDSDPSVYIPEASKDAWERVKKFFRKHLN